jgi:Flp pilus assembly protein TadD
MVRTRLLSVLLAVAVLAVFVPSLDNGFVWDYEQYVVGNPHVAGGLSAANAAWALGAFAAGNWHPLTWISHMADVSLFGMDPSGQRFVNLVLHAANTLLLFAVLRAATGALWRSLLVAALFGLHPLRVESVVWVAERKDLLSTLLALAAAKAHVGYVRRGGARRYAAVTGLFAAALAAKPMPVTLPFVLLLLDGWPLGRLTPQGWRRALAEKIPLLALSAASSIVTVLAQVSAGAYSYYPLGSRLSTAVVGYARYLMKAVAPLDLAVFYPHAEGTLPWWQTGAALAALGAATALVVLGRRRRPWLAVGWLWFGGTLVPVIGLVQVGQQAIADRYTYLPLVGVFLCAAWAAGEAAERWPRLRFAVCTAAAVAVLALAAATVRQERFWRDPTALFTHAIDAVPGNWLAHYNLGERAHREGRIAEAAWHYREALAVHPDHEKSLNNLGAIAAAQGRSADAIAYFRRALAARPAFADALVNLGREMQRQGRPAKAEEVFRQGLGGPGDAEVRVELARLLLRQRRCPEAAAEYERALRRGADPAQARNGLGAALACQGRYAEAAAQFREALRVAPDDPDAAANLARAQARLGR